MDIGCSEEQFARPSHVVRRLLLSPIQHARSPSSLFVIRHSLARSCENTSGPFAFGQVKDSRPAAPFRIPTNASQIRPVQMHCARIAGHEDGDAPLPMLKKCGWSLPHGLIRRTFFLRSQQRDHRPLAAMKIATAACTASARFHAGFVPMSSGSTMPASNKAFS